MGTTKQCEPSTSEPVEVIIISKTLFENPNAQNYDLPLAIVDYVNSMTTVGLYERGEFPIKAIQAFHCDYYLAQVNNGGHSQFVHNAGEKLALICMDTYEAFTSMNACEHLKILQSLMNWVQNNPEEVSKQTGFDGGIAEELKELDQRFFKQENVRSIYDFSTKWIRGWKEILLVENPNDALKELALNNPHRITRLKFQEISQIRFWVTDQLRGPLGLTAISSNKPEFVLAYYGGTYITHDNKSKLFWTVKTTIRNRFAVINDEETCLYEKIDKTQLSLFRYGNVRAKIKVIKSILKNSLQQPLIGRCINKIPADTTSKFIDNAKKHLLAEAIHLLLNSSGISEPIKSIALIKSNAKAMPSAQTAASILIDDNVYFTYVTDKAAVLVCSDTGSTIASTTVKELNAYHRLNRW